MTVMTDYRTDATALPVQTSERVERALLWLLVARIILALLGICLVWFLLQWSYAVKRDKITAPRGQHVPDEWKVVIPEYAGGGRGQGLVALKPWKFGTMEDHPVAVALCIAAAVLAAGAFGVCTWHAARLKRLSDAPSPPREN
jgi:hypothetical protein